MEKSSSIKDIELPKTPEGTPPVLLEGTPEESPQSSQKSNPKKDFEALVEFYLADTASYPRKKKYNR